MQKLLFSFALVIFSWTYLSGQSVVGKWKTIDDETGKPRSVVDIYMKGGKLYGKIIRLYRDPGEEQDPVCTECTGNLKGKKIIGMEIIDGLGKDDSVWEKDDGILDPENGKYYDVKIWLEDSNTLNVRGYIGFLFRTQTWYRL